jgi:hypothetical protein
MALSENIGRASGLTARFFNTTFSAVVLPTGGTEVAVNNLMDLETGTEAVDFKYVKNDVSNGSHFIFQANGAALIDVNCTLATLLAAGAVQQMLLQRRNPDGSWSTAASDLRIQDAAADTCKLRIRYRVDAGIAEDTGVSIFGTAYRVAFVSDTNTDEARIYLLEVTITRPESNRSLGS